MAQRWNRLKCQPKHLTSGDTAYAQEYSNANRIGALLRKLCTLKSVLHCIELCNNKRSTSSVGSMFTISSRLIYVRYRLK
ncbi:hypothetical protein NQ318_009903 [Aromia moschata]|uniref:Uncharacterized protein n=1 Tax=Aromia moschata TaxID=1265417 RepID=A0AAV8Y4I3_9CUCU|nr:hypothetical protein NQ318_009903 [Aromia moschata]